MMKFGLPENTVRLEPGEQPLEEDGAAHSLTGRFRRHDRFHSRFLPEDHDILVYLPPDYRAAQDRSYPVLYLQDGQNLFDGATSFIPGQEWHVDETAEGLIQSGAIEPLIIVGIYNAGSARMEEYTPTRDKGLGQGGRAFSYGRMLVDELKPFIDREYRTCPGCEHTGVGGSSLGGLVSAYLGFQYPHVFGKLALLSPSVWWDQRALLRMAEVLACKTGQRIWLDIGTEEGHEAVLNVRRLKEVLEQKGWVSGQDLAYHEEAGAPHSEPAWAGRMHNVLKFLYPPRSVQEAGDCPGISIW